MQTSVFLVLALIGVILGMAAGAAQGLDETCGVYLSDYAYLYCYSAPERVIALVTLKVFLVVAIRAITGGHGVVLLASSAAALQLNLLANRIERELPMQEDND